MLKGLIIKDIYCIKFQLITALLLTLFPNIILMLAGGGMTVYEGTFLSHDEAMLIGVFLYGMVNYITVTVFSSFLLNTLEDDASSGWAKMQRTMPVSGTQIVGGKILATLLIIAGLTVISLIFNILGVLLFEMSPEIMIALPICCGLLQIVTLCPVFPVSMKIGTKYTTALYVGMVVIIAIGMLILLISALSSDISETALRIIMYGGLPVLAAAVLGISYAAGKKSCETDM
ncbi:MAG: ABC-2 transporter permease [Oscillospiraceae bacterium]|nr:ABC-2 transporter permease [Oscillospiraceae bacterium]